MKYVKHFKSYVDVWLQKKNYYFEEINLKLINEHLKYLKKILLL